MDLESPCSSRYTPILEDVQSNGETRRRPSAKTPVIESTPIETKISVARTSSAVNPSVSFTSRIQSESTSSSTRSAGTISLDLSLARVFQEGRLRLQSLFRSFSNSSGPMCRICHECDSKEALISPCYCSGTMGLVHVTCMERWLSLSNSDVCELCHYKFKTRKIPKSFKDWLKDSRGSVRHQRSLVGDGVCFALLTPLAVVGAFLCIEGAHQQVLEGNRMEAGCLVALSAVLAVVYFLWSGLTCRYYYRQYKRWQLTNHNIQMIYMEMEVPRDPELISGPPQLTTNHGIAPYIHDGMVFNFSEADIELDREN